MGGLGCSSFKDLVVPASASNAGWRDVACGRGPVILAGLEELSAGWFSGWPFLTRVQNGGRVIEGCSNLREVAIPDSVTDIGGLAFCRVRS